MMWQRLDGRSTPAMAVRQVVQTVLGEALAQKGLRRERRVSSNTGALSRARKRLPLTIVEAVGDEIFTKLDGSRAMRWALARLFPRDGSSKQVTAHDCRWQAPNRQGQGAISSERVIRIRRAGAGHPRG